MKAGWVLAVTMMSCCGAVAAEPTADDVAREIIRNQFSTATMDELYLQAAQQASTSFQLAIQPTLKRAVTDDEKQRLLVFWHAKIKDLLPYSAVEDVIAPILTKNVSLEDLQEINRFTQSPAGRRYADVQALITRESRSAGEQLGRKLADKEWQTKIVGELKEEFPQWFPASPPNE
jgi:hypothetical protein